MRNGGYLKGRNDGTDDLHVSHLAVLGCGVHLHNRVILANVAGQWYFLGEYAQDGCGADGE